MKIRLLFCLILGFLINANAQDFPKNYFQKPLDIPLYLSGNFGELRSNHYHSGIDIKTKEREGYKVYATADGFVSRIKVGLYGYGNAIYISHPNGYTTVYAHLQKFAPKIEKIVRDFQYKLHSFEIDKTLSANKIKVKKGEIIALSGNSGSSGGPHLHFEIRETKSQRPTNPLLYGFAISDTIQPVARMLYLYDLENNTRKSYTLEQTANQYKIANNEIPKVFGKLGIGLDMRDYMNETTNYYGIYQLRMFVDDVLQHSFKFDKIFFGESRYINAHIDYELSKTEKRRIHKLFHEPNQKESFTTTKNKGISFTDNKLHKIFIEVKDAYGNDFYLNFQVQNEVKTSKKKQEHAMWNFRKKNTLKTDNFFVEIPPMALYKNVAIPKVQRLKCKGANYTPLYHFLDKTVALHKAMKVGIYPQKLPKNLKKKAFLARKNDKNFSFISKKWERNFLVGKTKTIGNFTVLVDTIPPKIDLWKGASFQKTGKLRYKITDDLAGIETFKGTIDGKWVLFEYDPKTHQLWHTLTAKRITKGQRHKLVLEIADACGNKAIRKAEFKW